MGDGIYVALSGAIQQSNTLDTTAANLANSSTDGYQRLRPVFNEVLAGESGPKTLHFSGLQTTMIDRSRGPVKVTGRALDVALPKETFLAVSTSRGERYTRAGAITVARDGTLTASGGNPLLNEEGKAIKVDPRGGEVAIAPSGEVVQGNTTVARLRHVAFANTEGLVPEGGTLFNATQTAGAPKLTKEPLEIGALEESNATVVSSMTDLVTASRTFEVFQRAIQAFNDADRKVINVESAG